MQVYLGQCLIDLDSRERGFCFHCVCVWRFDFRRCRLFNFRIIIMLTPTKSLIFSSRSGCPNYLQGLSRWVLVYKRSISGAECTRCSFMFPCSPHSTSVVMELILPHSMLKFLCIGCVCVVIVANTHASLNMRLASALCLWPNSEYSHCACAVHSHLPVVMF